MLFEQTLQPAKLLKRYKRFLADVQLPDGKLLTVHCPNSGSMLGCNIPGLPVMISRAENPKRKYPFTLEMIKVNSYWVGINTSLTNKLVREAMEDNLFPEFEVFTAIKPEVKTGASRLDFLLTGGDKPTYVEVKNCTLVRDGIAMFPDAVTTRGTRHLHELQSLREAGNRTAVIFCVQRQDTDLFAPAADIDPLYAKTLTEVSKAGVLALACQAEVTPKAIIVNKRLPVVI